MRVVVFGFIVEEDIAFFNDTNLLDERAVTSMADGGLRYNGSVYGCVGVCR